MHQTASDISVNQPPSFGVPANGRNGMFNLGDELLRKPGIDLRIIINGGCEFV